MLKVSYDELDDPVECDAGPEDQREADEEVPYGLRVFIILFYYILYFSCFMSVRVMPHVRHYIQMFISFAISKPSDCPLNCLHGPGPRAYKCLCKAVWCLLHAASSCLV